MSDETDALLRELVEVQRRTAESLAELVDLKTQEAKGELQPHWMKAKPADVWIACREELLRLLDENPLVDWDTARQDETFRDPKIGNIYRENQWRRFLKNHAIPNKPEDGTDALLVGFGKEDKNGPPAVARKDSLHCAKEMFEREGWTWERYRLDEACSFCQQMKARPPKQSSGYQAGWDGVEEALLNLEVAGKREG